MRWILRQTDDETATNLSRELGISPLLARLLALRGLSDPAQASRFLQPRFEHLHDPFLMRDMSAAVTRLEQAISAKEKILIYGDYDVDGTMAVVVLLTALKSLGAGVEAYIPHRLTDGYGMRAPVMERAARDGCRVVVSVDTGIREHEALGSARALGLDCIVTDHHLPGPELPEACAVLNPHRSDCAYPDKNLSGVGVAFKLAQALLGSRLSERAARSYLKIVAIGSIADIVPLAGENRVIAHYGLAGLNEAAMPAGTASAGRAGLSALLSVAGLGGKKISTGDVAFRIAPRLNAAGRMESARDVIDLFTGSGGATAQEIAERLDTLNRNRQQTEESIVAEIKARVAAEPRRSSQYSLVFSGENWHRGVIGIAAQRVVDIYYRPALVMAVENGTAHGSGRSIPGFHLLDALTESKHLFERFGGHAQAAGFSLPSSRIGELEEALEAYARTILSPAALEPALRVDAQVNLQDLSWDFYEQLKKLEPCGCGNPQPVFTAKVDLKSPARILKEKHLKIRVAQQKIVFDAVGWRMAERAAELVGEAAAEIAFTLGETSFQGERELQLVLKDFRPVDGA
ncbi:MAG TPA: single-stranded-DNA-specific exonuclease RecJ [Terriglobia bacterium]|nr:single-stranded-DNA-specific exonuclease RecJ [Terriglobia bacterium]